MKNKIAISLDQDIFDFLEKNLINKSSYINALIRKFGMINHTFISKEKTAEQEAEELLNAPRTD